MSAFLAPIHHQMFQRIELAAARQEDLAAYARGRMSPGQCEELEARWTLRHELPAGELEELIGGAPIHAWLQGQMEAQLVSEAQLWALLADRPERRGLVLGRLREHGLRLGEALLTERPELAGDLRELPRELERVVLESMPCDRVSQVVAASAGACIVRRDLLFHARLWQKAGLDEELALACLEGWMRGLHEALPGLRFTRAAVQVEGRRLFDDRVSLARAAQEA
jgi:hypothetical protein